MRHIPFVLFMLALLLTASACSGKEDIELMDGTWLPVEGEMAGEPFPDEVLESLKLTMSDGKYTAYVEGQLDTGTVKLDPTTEPKSMDVIGIQGPNQGRAFLGIYELKGDTLRICYDLTAGSRPAEFKTADGSSQFLVSYKREKLKHLYNIVLVYCEFYFRKCTCILSKRESF